MRRPVQSFISGRNSSFRQEWRSAEPQTPLGARQEARDGHCARVADDRFARSTHALVDALNEFNALGIDFISLQEGTDTTTPQGKLVFAIMAGLAEFESSLISERVKAGMERAKAEGKRTVQD